MLEEIKDFRNYLFIMSRNEIISAMRKKLKETETEDAIQNLKTNVLPDSQLEYKEFYLKFMEGVEMLPPVRKTVFKMSLLEGKTYDEIATEMSISKNTVKEHMVLALSFIRAFLHAYKILFLAVLSVFLLSA